MKYHQTIAALGCALLAINIAHSAILTVDNKVGAVAMFTNLTAAYNAAQEGDTILLAASPASYGNLSIFKRINIKGSGYKVSQNGITGLAGDSSIIGEASIGRSDTLGNGSGSSFSGVYIVRYDVQNNTSGAFDQCEILEWRSNYFLGMSAQWAINRCTIVNGPLLVSNNTLRNSVATSVDLRGSGNTVSSCVIAGNLSASEPSNSVTNSIIVNSGYTAETFAAVFKGSITHSMAVGNSVLPDGRRSFLPGGGGNLNGFNSADVFVPSGSADGKWQLKVGSPAIAAGFAGVDMGAFGGVTPYILSGIPPRPRITRLVVPAAATDATGLQFEVDAKAF